MTNALSIYDGGRFEVMQRAAKAMVASGYFKDSQDIAQAVTKVMAGAELGIPPFAAMTGIHIIQGKPALGANLIATLVKNDPRYNYKVSKCDNTSCQLAWFEDGEKVGVSEFTFEEAKNAGLTGKDNWKKYTSDMLFARAITRGARRFAPGIFGGSPIYTPDELGADIDPDGYIDAQSVQGDDFNQDVYEDDFNQTITVDGEIVEAEEQPTMNSKTADFRAALETADKITLGTVADYAKNAGMFSTAQLALKAIDNYQFPDGVKIEMKQVISNAGAVKVWDWLTEQVAA